MISAEARAGLDLLEPLSASAVADLAREFGPGYLADADLSEYLGLHLVPGEDGERWPAAVLRSADGSYVAVVAIPDGWQVLVGDSLEGSEPLPPSSPGPPAAAVAPRPARAR